MFKRTGVRPPRVTLKNLLWACIGGTAGALSIITGVGFYIVESLIHPKRAASFDAYAFTPFELGLPAEEVVFPPLYGQHKVAGWYVPCENATTTIILSPGYRGRRSDMLGMCAVLWKDGHNVLVFEYYGHGEVVGTPVTLGYREINDFLGAVSYARQRAPQARIGVVGYSMGAAVSIMGSARTTEVEALVADSAFATHRRVIEYAVRRVLHVPFIIFDVMTDLILWLRAGYRFSQVEPLRDVPHIAPRPLLIIHGTRDSVVDPDDAPLLYSAAGEPKEIWLWEGVEHCGAYFADRVKYTTRVKEFFNKHLREAVAEGKGSETTAVNRIRPGDEKQQLSSAS